MGGVRVPCRSFGELELGVSLQCVFGTQGPWRLAIYVITVWATTASRGGDYAGQSWLFLRAKDYPGNFFATDCAPYGIRGDLDGLATLVGF